MMTNLDPTLSGRLAELQHRPEEMALAIGALWLPSAEELAERARRHLADVFGSAGAASMERHMGQPAVRE
jgi:hypothetical protein